MSLNGHSASVVSLQFSADSKRYSLIIVVLLLYIILNDWNIFHYWCINSPIRFKEFITKRFDSYLHQWYTCSHKHQKTRPIYTCTMNTYCCKIFQSILILRLLTIIIVNMFCTFSMIIIL